MLDDLKRYEESIPCYEKAIQIDPNVASAWFNKGNTLYSLKRYEEAIQCYERAIQINPNNASAWFNKGITLSDLRRQEEAIKCFDRAIQINPNYASAWDKKGSALRSLNRYDEALACLDRALEINPNNADIKKNRELVLKESSKNAQEGRLTSLRSGEGRQPPQPDAHPGEPVGLRKSITIERTVYDPLTQDFIVSSSRPLVNVKDWIDRHDPNSYWLVICVHNHGDHAIDEWGIELNSFSSLKVVDTYIEGHEGGVTVMKSHPMPWLSRWVFGVSHQAGIVIPRGGSRRIYIKLGSDACGVSHSITGRFMVSQGVEVPIREKTFTHSCDVATLRVALSKDPAIAETYAQNIILRDYERDTGLKILQSLRQVQEINQYCALQNYDKVLRGMRNLAATLEVTNAGDNLTNPVKQCCNALEILGDREASVERAQQCCSDIYDIWINEFIISGGRRTD